MFATIMIPVDLAHQDHLGKALQCGADLARQYGSRVIYVSVSTAAPSSVAHNPAEFNAKLQSFAASQAETHGITADALAVFSHDPVTDLDPTLLKATKDTGADLVVMASHLPRLTDYIWPSNGGTIASHSGASVFVVRG